MTTLKSKGMGVAHLHTHSHYSILDGGATPRNYFTEADSHTERPAAIALTDHASMGGLYKAYNSSLETGIPFIAGIEAYVAPHDRTHKSPVFWGTEDQRSNDVGAKGARCHITLLAKNAVGLRNLFRLHYDSYTQGFYGKPRIDLSSLEQHSEGLIALSGCVGSILGVSLRLGQRERGRQYLSDLKDIFGGDAFVELMNHGIPEEDMIATEILELARELDMTVVATSDSHYATPDMADAHDTLLCVQTGAKKAQTNRFRFNGAGYHLPTGQEMFHTFREFPSAVTATQDVVERWEGYGDHFEGRLRLPRMSEDEAGALRDLCRLPELTTPERERAEFELEVIEGAGFSGYFLVVKELIDLARAEGIRVGPGRGSAGGSFVAYRTGITQLNPLPYGLLFERFLNPDRISFPDIDSDIDDRKRDRFFEIACERFGRQNVAHIGTYGVIGAKRGLRDSAKVLGYSFDVGSKLVSLLPRAKFGREPSLAELPATASPKEVVTTARKLEGLIRAQGVHASGVIISPDNLVDLFPVRVSDKGQGNLVTEIDMHELEKSGMVKFDFLGLATLGVIDECLRMLNQNRESQIPGELPSTFDSDSVYERLGQGDTSGIFQLEGSGMRSLLKRVKPTSLEDLAAVLALYRPGPMGSNSHTAYADRKNGRAFVEYPHPEFESSLAACLSPTYGLVVYQEQVLQGLAAVGGYTYATAEIILRAMGKKDTQKMLSARPEYEDRLRANGYSQDAIDSLWQVFVSYSDYGFNKAHAIGYAMVAYWCAYLRYNHPKEWWCALLTTEEDPDQLRGYIYSTLDDGVPVLAPDVNRSGYGWSVVDDDVRFGIGSIKGISQKTFDHLDGGRPYLSMDDFWKRAPKQFLNVGVLTAACKSGLFDSLEPNREQLFANLEGLAARAQADRELAKKGHTRLWTGYEVLPGDRRLGLRQTWEKEVLGIALTRRAVHLKMRRKLTEDEWAYVREVFARNFGDQQVYVHINELAVLKNVGRIALTDSTVTALQTVDLDIHEEE